LNTALVSCKSLIRGHFELPEDELSVQCNSEEELTKALASIINTLLNQDMQRLLNAFYKIDLDESIFKEILSKLPPDRIALTLAKEVIKREMQKIVFRKKYRES